MYFCLHLADTKSIMISCVLSYSRQQTCLRTTYCHSLTFRRTCTVPSQLYINTDVYFAVCTTYGPDSVRCCSFLNKYVPNSATYNINVACFVDYTVLYMWLLHKLGFVGCDKQGHSTYNDGYKEQQRSKMFTWKWWVCMSLTLCSQRHLVKYDKVPVWHGFDMIQSTTFYCCLLPNKTATGNKESLRLGHMWEESTNL